MEFSLSPEIASLRARIADFVTEHILPLEGDAANFDDHENIRIDLLEDVRANVKAAGLWAPQMPTDRGGLGLDIRGMAVCYEEMARSRPPKDRPWYHVLVDGAAHMTYVTEQNLEPDLTGDPITHPALDHYFDELRDGLYVRDRAMH